MSEPWVELHTEAAVARVVLNRADKRNALTRSMLERMNQVVDRIADDHAIRVVRWEANGPVFCAGMDLGEMRERAAADNPEQEWLRDSQVYRDLVGKIALLHCPTIAVVQGPAVAGGCGLVLACDLVICSDQAAFALPEPARGITAAMVTPLLLLRGGASGASSLLLTGERVSAQAALRMGLCHDCVPPDALAGRVDDLCRAIQTNGPAAMRLTKQHLLNTAAANLRQQLQDSASVSAAARASDEAKEGLAAFLEKRTPQWQVN